MKLYLDGIGLLAPGIADWPRGRDILSGRSMYQPAEVALAASDLLPPAERRRTTDTVKLALAIGAEATLQAARAANGLVSIFASSGSDPSTITAILDILASPAREVSPTRFHNSVHNAPSGYWGMATGSQEASTSICAYDFSFAAGLIEAASQTLTRQQAALLVAYDLPYTSALHAVRPIFGVFGVALVLSPEPTARSLACLSVAIRRDCSTTTMADAGLEGLRSGNPAARSLPLLAAVARRSTGSVFLPYVSGNLLAVEIAPVPEARP